MHVTKSNSSKRPAYPTRHQFLAALGLGALVAATPACVHTRKTLGAPICDPPAFREAETLGAPPFDPAWVKSTGTGAAYVVQKGDTLYGIAKTELGNARRWKDIAALNPALDPARLAVGSTIRLPAKD